MTDVRPNPEPSREPFDPHLPPLDDDDDARYLDPVDPRRLEVERTRGCSFNDDDVLPAEFEREGDC